MLDVLWKAIVMLLVGTLLLRIAGPKSISQLTVQQTVIMISIDRLLSNPSLSIIYLKPFMRPPFLLWRL